MKGSPFCRRALRSFRLPAADAEDIIAEALTALYAGGLSQFRGGRRVRRLPESGRPESRHRLREGTEAAGSVSGGPGGQPHVLKTMRRMLRPYRYLSVPEHDFRVLSYPAIPFSEWG
jgi:hypothetical protein